MTIILILYALLVGALTFCEYKRLRNWQIILKPLAAAGFIVIALLGGAIYCDYGLLILMGLIACAAGDVLLLPRDKPLFFKLGMAAFAIGHLLYFYAFRETFDSGVIKIFPIFAGLVFFFWIRPKLPKDMVIPVAIYSIIIIAMVVFAFKSPIMIIPIAALMFAISDMFVARDRFVKDEGLNALAITPLYFGAQALFALSTSLAI